jgi:hypothetical protein
MLAQLIFSGTINLAQVHGDIIGILTGAITDPDDLSASFNAGASSIVSDVEAGWELYDSAAGSVANSVTPKVIRSPWSDDGSKYKNMYIASISSTQLVFNGYETWDAATHTGTYPMRSSPSAGSWQTLDLTSATYASGKLIISAGPNHFFILTITSVNVIGDLLFCTEYTRDDPWSTVENGYPSWLLHGLKNGSGVASTMNAAVCRAFNTTTLTDTASGGVLFANDLVGCLVGTTNRGSQATITTLFPINTVGSVAATINGAGSNKLAAKYLYPVAVRQQAVSNFSGCFLGGDMTAKNSAVYQIPWSLGDYLDTLEVDGDEYLIVGHAYNSAVRIALRIA